MLLHPNQMRRPGPLSLAGWPQNAVPLPPPGAHGLRALHTRGPFHPESLGLLYRMEQILQVFFPEYAEVNRAGVIAWIP